MDDLNKNEEKDLSLSPPKMTNRLKRRRSWNCLANYIFALILLLTCYFSGFSLSH